MKKTINVAITTLCIIITILCGFSIYSDLTTVVIDHEEIVYKYNPTVIINQKYESIIGLFINNTTFCTGVVIDSHYALTAAHCVKDIFGSMDRSDIRVVDIEKKHTGITAKAVAMDTLNDISLLKGDFSLFNTAPVDFKGVYINDISKIRAISCGFPHGGTFFCSVGRLINNMEFKLLGSQFILKKGMSGGPLLISFSPSEFIVIGINSAVSENYTIFGSLIGLDSQFGIE